MCAQICAVHHTVRKLGEMIDSGQLKTPRNRWTAEAIRTLINDIASGNGGAEHLHAVDAKIKKLNTECTDEGCRKVADFIAHEISRNREVFSSHIDTHNCPTGDCVRLAPAPCQLACPAGLDIPSYVALIGMGRDAEAIDVIRQDCPFPWVCGRVCTRPCEFKCVRGRIDTPIAIRALKGFAAERAMSGGSYRNPSKGSAKGKKVCVIGSGPAGLSAAYYLALKGYGVRVIEQHAVAGGMMLLGIPRYRLPRGVIDSEVEMLQQLEVEFGFNTRFGSDITLDQLKREGFEAFFFAIGAQLSFKLNIPGETDFPQVIDAIDLLRRVAMGDRQPPGKNVIVIGGGNVAIDAARTCLRLRCESVVLAYRRTQAEMPADREEIEQAKAEGVRFEFLTGPHEIVGKQGRLEGLKCLRAKLVSLKGQNRKFPKAIVGSDFFMEADVVISAIGQQVDADCLESMEELVWTRRRTIQINTITTETGMQGIFAAGDAVSGPATVIEAIAGGKRAAESIHRYLSGIPQPEMPPVPSRRGRINPLEVAASTKMTLQRPDMPLLKVDRRRKTFQQVELGYSEDMAREEALRCLRCDICMRCGICVEICRDQMGLDALHINYFDFDHPAATDYRITEERCILCGACAINCPTGAMRIEDSGGERILSLCGTILICKKLLRCEMCGAVLGSAPYLDFVNRRTRSVARVVSDRHLCDCCARKSTAASRADNMPLAKVKPGA